MRDVWWHLAAGSHAVPGPAELLHLGRREAAALAAVTAMLPRLTALTAVAVMTAKTAVISVMCGSYMLSILFLHVGAQFSGQHFDRSVETKQCKLAPLASKSNMHTRRRTQ